MMRKDCRGSFRRLAARQNAPPDGDCATKPVITKERKEKKNKAGRPCKKSERDEGVEERVNAQESARLRSWEEKSCPLTSTNASLRGSGEHGDWMCISGNKL